MIDVLLTSMPFGDVFAPSMGLSLLQPQVRRRGLTCQILYLNLLYAARVGQGFYCSVASNTHGSLLDFVGEWLFAEALTPRGPDAERAYVQQILVEGQAWPRDSVEPLTSARIAAILEARTRVPEFLDACVDRVLAASPRIVGFTSVFQQHVASLALARRIKALCPETFIVFGGANCEGVMGAETQRQFPFVDAVVSGEGDLVFGDLVARVVEGKPVADLPGVLTPSTARRAFAFGQFPHTPMVADLDALPHPDYTDYFAQFNESRFARDWQPSVYMETSRGCWWGERMHCTFCGLNGSTMKFRSKSVDRAYGEFEALSRLYPGCDIQIVDNILDLQYFKTLLPELARSPLKLDLFYETKSNLKKEQIRLLHDAGVKSIQPGIESLSDAVLKLMKKGVSGLQNLQLLKWCKQYGVAPHWNLIFGFPGEPAGEYERMAELVPRLMHLPGPVSAGPIRLDRFSPNFFDAERLGLTGVRPLAPYRFLYDFPDEVLGNLAYYFAYEYREPIDVGSYVRRLLPRLAAWGSGWRRFELLTVDGDGMMALVDTRPAAHAPLTLLCGVDRAIYLACDAVADLDAVTRSVRAAGFDDAPHAIEARLAAMVERGIVARDGGRYLALAVPLGDYEPTGRAAARVLGVLSAIGRRVDGALRVPLDCPAYRLGSPRSRRLPVQRAVLLRRERRARPVRLTAADVRIARGELRVERAAGRRVKP